MLKKMGLEICSRKELFFLGLNVGSNDKQADKKNLIEIGLKQLLKN